MPHYQERFAQQALGHNSKAVHNAYAKHAEITVSSLDDWEKDWQENPQRSAATKVVAGGFPVAVGVAGTTRSFFVRPNWAEVAHSQKKWENTGPFSI